jgi:hypothetical protein
LIIEPKLLKKQEDGREGESFKVTETMKHLKSFETPKGKGLNVQGLRLERPRLFEPQRTRRWEGLRFECSRFKVC